MTNILSGPANTELLTHEPVMAGEVLDFLHPVPGGIYLDGTVGLGGHALHLLRSCQGKCRLLGMDLDDEAIGLAENNLKEFAGQIHLVPDSYHNFDLHLQDIGPELLNGALLDLGMSSLQLDKKDRGFSFLHDGPLDMRMGKATGFEPAANLVHKASFSRLKKILYEYGEEPMASRIARAIIQAREKQSISTTLSLARTVEQAYPAQRRRSARNHPATKTFQALRIAVNKELEHLEKFLKKIGDYLKPEARLVIISFHSLEDRMVKHFFRQQASACLCPPRTPFCSCGHEKKFTILTKKPLTATRAEMMHNPRSRSAKLRAAQRI